MIKEISLIALVALGTGSLFLGMSLTPALGQASPNTNGRNGFGMAASNFATSCPPGSLGAHASSGPTPHLGIGELANNGNPPPHGGSVGARGTMLNDLRTSLPQSGPPGTPTQCNPGFGTPTP